jgi:hypothetical protein
MRARTDRRLCHASSLCRGQAASDARGCCAALKTGLPVACAWNLPPNAAMLQASIQHVPLELRRTNEKTLENTGFCALVRPRGKGSWMRSSLSPAHPPLPAESGVLCPRVQCFAKCPFTCQFDRLSDQIRQSLDRLSDNFAKHCAGACCDREAAGARRDAGCRPGGVLPRGPARAGWRLAGQPARRHAADAADMAPR